MKRRLANAESEGGLRMTDTVACLRCRTPMEEGFVVDSAHGGVSVQEQWAAGPAEKSFWTGLKTRGKRLLPVTTLRCPACGYLESYARPA